MPAGCWTIPGKGLTGPPLQQAKSLIKSFGLTLQAVGRQNGTAPHLWGRPMRFRIEDGKP